MKGFFSANIKRMVLLAVFLSVLPPLVMLLVSGMERYRLTNEAVEKSGRRTVESVADRMQMYTENTLTLLFSLRRLSSLKPFSPESEIGVYLDVITEYPLFNNIFLFSLKGEILSSAVPVPPNVSLADSPLFSCIQQEIEACALPSAVSPFTGMPVLQYAIPLTDRRGRTYAFLGAGLHLSFMDSVFAGESILPGGVVSILSDTGLLLLSSEPEAKALAGSYGDAALWSALCKEERKNGMFSFVDSRGRRSIALYRRLFLPGSADPYLHVVMTIGEDAAYAQPDAFLRRDSLLLTAAAAGALFCGLVLCHLGFTRPVRQLMHLATRLGKGDLAARVSRREYLHSEFAALGEEFDAMAESLEARSQELKESRAAAIRSSQAKSEFLANMSHEIRTPMNAIIGMAHLVGRTQLNEAQRSMVVKVGEAGEDLLQLINNILDYSKIEAGKMRVEKIPLHLGRLLTSVRACMAVSAAERGVSLVTNIAPDTPAQLMGDASRLTHALSILLGEALRHCRDQAIEIGCRLGEEGGEAAAPVEKTDHRTGFWSMSQAHAAGELPRERRTLQVSMTVRGAPLCDQTLDDIRRCFDGHGGAVTRLDNTELNLMLSSALLRLLGGKAEVDNLENGYRLIGAFRLIEPQERCEEQLLHFNDERVLLVDDNSGARNAMRTLLERCSMRVDESSDLPQALDLMRQAASNKSPFALVITDIPPASFDVAHYLDRLKKGNGAERAPLLVLSSSAEYTQLLPEFFNSGVDAFLPRPMNESLLVDTLSGLLKGRHDAEANGEYGGTGRGDCACFNGLRVLLVDDNAVNREIARAVLENAGIAVSQAVNGQEALNMCRDIAANSDPCRPLPYDLVLMDVEMPVMDGKTAARALRSRPETGFWRLPIIAMTAHSGVDEVAACLGVGMNDYTVKPISLKQLFRAIRRWLPPDPDPAAWSKALADMLTLRDLLLLSYARDPKIQMPLERLASFLGEGRSESLRRLIRGDNPRGAAALLDEYLAGWRPLPEDARDAAPGATPGATPGALPGALPDDVPPGAANVSQRRG